MEKPSEYSRGCEPDEYDLEIYDVSAVMLAGDRAAVAYGGLIHIYELTEEGEVLETVRADLADAFRKMRRKAILLFQPGCGSLKTALYL